jgi:hypothetical protein
MFVKCFQLSLRFESEVGAYLCRSSPLGNSGLSGEHLTKLERLALDKHTSLFCPFIRDDEKKFYNFDTRLSNGSMLPDSFLLDLETS